MPVPAFLRRPGVVVFVLAATIAAVALGWRAGAWDVENDEAIYTYAVERMLDTGDWLTPKEIPYDFAFLEKPPLKFWMVAAPIRLGIVPRTPFGFRLVDVLLGAIAFGYVALFGYRLAGPAAAIASCLILFGMRDLVLVHGLRSNNMEASLVAAYAGGLYHFLRWRGTGARRDALIVGGWFTLAFLTKFVAAAFLPLVAIVSLALPRPGLLPKPLRAALADWGWAAVLCLAASAPWFVFAYATYGWTLIDTIFLQHVLARFTGALDPTHLQPWDHYVLGIRRMLDEARCTWLVAAGAILLAWRVAQRRDGLAWTVVVWAALPIALVSGLSSKVLHYAYPFLPPFALAGGVALASPIGMLKGPLDRLATRLENARVLGLAAFLGRPAVRRTLLTIGAVAVVLAALALVAGTAKYTIGGVVLRNSSVMRPLTVAVICFALARAWRHALTAVPVAVMALFPLGASRETLIWAGQPRGGLMALRDCARPLVEAGRVNGGAYAVSAAAIPHPYTYYQRSLGPWEVVDADHPALRGDALFAGSGQRAVVLSDRAFSDLALRLLRDGHPVPPAIAVQPGHVVLLPGSLGTCVDAVVRGGGRSVGGPSAPAP